MMNTIKLFFILCTVLVSSALKGQAAINPDIQSSLDAFIKYSNDQDWDKAFDLLYPKLFKQVAKQDLVDLMVAMEADGMSLRMTNTRITSTSAPMEEGNETFVRIEYTADMEVDIAAGGIYDHPKAITSMEEQFKTTYGSKNVKWDVDNKEFNILARKSMMAINGVEGGWKLIEINMDQAELMKSLFSPSVMEALVLVE